MDLPDGSDWEHEQSTAGTSGGGRTHAFAVKNAAQELKDAAVYPWKDAVIRDGKPVPENGDND